MVSFSASFEKDHGTASLRTLNSGEGRLRVGMSAPASLLSRTVKDTQGWVADHFKAQSSSGGV